VTRKLEDILYNKVLQGILINEMVRLDEIDQIPLRKINKDIKLIIDRDCG
jgi:predicted transcriptional regulator